MDKKIKVIITVGILILIGLAFYITSYLITKYTGYSITGKIVYTKEEQIQIAKCLNERGVVLYCSDLALNCLRQKKALGNAFQYMNYADCSENAEECKDLSLPAWKINNRIYYGIKDLNKLVEVTGCNVRV